MIFSLYICNGNKIVWDLYSVGDTDLEDGATPQAFMWHYKSQSKLHILNITALDETVLKA